MARVIFVISLALLVYNYFLYPLLVIVRARFGSRCDGPPEYADGSPLPSVGLIIAAYNEERVIDAKIRNSLALNYPRDQLSIVVVSDGSTDGTPAIARQHESQGVRSLHEAPRRGKTAALNRAVAAVTADIIVFSDANNMFAPDALTHLMRHFKNPSVGGVCGLKQIHDAADRESSRGDSLYWRYESAIKDAESRIDSITTADGEIFAVRRALYEPIDEAVINDDAEITFLLIRKGYRVLYERAARSFEEASIHIEDDFQVKVRMVCGGFQTIARHLSMLFPPRTWFSYTFLSHKLLRWLAPELMILVALSSLVLAQEPFFLAVIVLQVVFYLLAAAGWLTRRRAHWPAVVYIPFYFCAMNLAALLGLWRFLAGTQSTRWHKAER